RFEYKVEAGAEFVITRPVFDLERFGRFLKRIETARLPIVATVVPFESARHAEFFANEVPGTTVPDAVLERMRQAEGTGAAGAEGLTIARELSAGLRQTVQGLQVSTQSGDI